MHDREQLFRSTGTHEVGELIVNFRDFSERFYSNDDDREGIETLCPVDGKMADGLCSIFLRGAVFEER